MLSNFFSPISFCYKDFQLWNYIHLPKDELLLVLNWRNLYAEYFLNSNPVKEEEHLFFVRKLSRDRTKFYWLVKDKQNTPLGCIYLTHIDWEKREAHLGLFKNPQLTGVGRILIDLLIGISRGILKLEVLKLEVLETNKRAISLYLKSGFVLTGRFEKGERVFLTFERKL